MDTISIRGARTNNLKNIDVDIPKNKLVVITGLSGSGKSSLAFDTLYAEGQRRYCESLSAYARQFMDIEDKPDIESVSGITPTIAISQASSRGGSRSTVGTVSEITEYLKLLFSRAGIPYCPHHDEPLRRFGIHDMVDAALGLKEGTKIAIIAPMKPIDSSEAHSFLQGILKQGFVRARFKGTMETIEELLARSYVGAVKFEIVVDRLRVSDLARTRMADSFETAVNLSNGFASILDIDTGATKNFNTIYGCPVCGYAIDELAPAMFSFNNSLGACPSCSGLGVVERFDELLMINDPALSLRNGAIFGWSSRNHVNFEKLKRLSETLGFSLSVPFRRLSQEVKQCIFHGYGDFVGVMPELQEHWDRARSETTRMGMKMFRSVKPCLACEGTRYRSEVRHVYVGQKENRINIAQFTSLTLDQLDQRLATLTFDEKEGKIAEGLMREIRRRLGFLRNVGLGYLRLDREVKTLSGGEMQRLRLAGQIGSGLTGVTYVLDEPTVGLHPSDTNNLINTLKALVEIGNTVVVVEHDESVIRAADWIIDIGPGAGEFGGEILATGTLEDLLGNPDSVTGRSLLKKHKTIQKSQKVYDRFITISGARGHNLKNVTCRFPVGAMTAVTGVSGSGKSSLLLDTLTAWLRYTYYRSTDPVLPFDGISGIDAIDKLVIIDQSPIGKNPKSNPATYAGFFTPIRTLFSETISARERGYDAGRFSFNTPGGRCEACEGDGQMKIEMNFLPSVYVTCPVCHGKRYNCETLEVKFKGKSIADVLAMTVDEARSLFRHPGISRHLQTLQDVGLGYIRLGQSATTLSGGEAQRVKLAGELAKLSTGKTLYVLDEPTTGLHFEDVEILLKVLKRLRDEGNTVLMIEHNPDVIRACDWIVELGPGGGETGGCLLTEGSLTAVLKDPKSKIRNYL